MADPSMLERFESSYQRMEQALQRLTDSIAAYQPSVTASEELVAADDELKSNIELLVRHQQNVRRIAELQEEAQELDADVRTKFQQAADLRKEINAIPSTSIPPARETTVDEILSFARFISPTTIPPTFRKQDVTLKPVKGEPPDRQTTNGIATPPPAVGTQEGTETEAAKAESAAMQTLKPEEKAWLDPLAGLPFEPWPSLDKINAGALGRIQKMVEDGKDPASILSPEEQAEADRRRAEEEERERLEEQERERRNAHLFDGMRRRAAQDQSDVFDPDA